MVTEVLGGGKFYVQTVGDQKVASIQHHLASLNIQEAPVIGSFNPKKGDVVLAQFSADNSWNRAMVRVATQYFCFFFNCKKSSFLNFLISLYELKVTCEIYQFQDSLLSSHI